MMNLLSQDRCKNKSIQNDVIHDFYFITIDSDLHVSVGDIVSEGQVLTSNSQKHLLTHSPVAGIIKEIQHHQQKSYLVLETDKTILPQKYELSTPVGFPTSVLIKKIYNAGVNGLEEHDDEYTVHEKLTKAYTQGNIDTVVINAVDGEPFVVGDYMLLLEKTREIIQVAHQLRLMLGAKNIIFAISKNKQLKETIEQFIFDDTKIVVELNSCYPLNSDKLLINKLIKKELSKSKLCSDAGVVVFTPTVFYAMYEALFYNKPVTDRVITVDGAYSVAHGVFRVKLGTPIAKFMRPFSVENSYVMFSGGPLQGQILEKEKGITKNMNAIMIFEGTNTSPEKQLCTYCSSCVEACPIRLEPVKLVDFIECGEYDRAFVNHLQECINCNLCSYVCPSFIPLGKIIKEGQMIKKDPFNA